MVPETVICITVKVPDKFYGGLAYKQLKDRYSRHCASLFMCENTITVQYITERGTTKPELEKEVRSIGTELRTKIPVPHVIEINIRQHRTVWKDNLYTTVDTTVGIILK